MYGRTHRIHFIGIGGSGMSGLAEVLLNMGYEVSGSDLKATDVTDRLVEIGGRVFTGHAAENVEGAQVVVYSSAVRQDNPELVTARAAGVPVIARADMLPDHGGPQLRSGWLTEGMVLAIEPMVNSGRPETKVLSDKWTAVTLDGSYSAHFEHCVAVTRKGPEILTQ